jgi:transketolase
MALRPYEAIRNGPLFHRLPVRLIAVGGGTDYGQQGLTHYALEDISIMRVQPELMVIAPADSRQAQAALTATWNAPGPIYYRLGKDEAPDLPNLDGRFDPDGVEFVRQGDDVLFLATGPISREALAAADMLSLDGIEASVGVVAALNPAPGALAPLVRRFRAIVTAEAHYVVGGLGSLVSETVADQGAATRVLRAGFTRMPQSTTGSREHLYREHGLNREALRDLALTALERPVPNR